MKYLKKYGCFCLCGLLINALFGYSIHDYETWVFIVSIGLAFEIRLEQVISELK